MPGTVNKLSHLLAMVSVIAVGINVCQQTTASSSAPPSFVRQEIERSPVPWVDKESMTYDTNVQEPFYMNAISYASDGRILDGILWLNSTYSERSGHNASFGMLIDVDSDPATGWNGADYKIEITRVKGTWHETLEELTTSGQFRRVTNHPVNMSFLDKQNKSIHLKLELSPLNSPSQYFVKFFIEDKFVKISKTYDIADYSDWIAIPPSEFSVTPVPASVDLRPGESRTVDFQIKSLTAHSLKVYLDPVQTGGIVAAFRNVLVDVLPYDTESSFLRVYAENSADDHHYTLRIKAKPFPTSEYSTPSISTTEVGSNFKTSKSLVRPVISVLDITVLKPVDYNEVFNNFWNTYGDALSLIGAGFVGGLATYVFDYLKNRRSRIRNQGNVVSGS